MNEGFFSAAQIKTFAKPKVLPPRLNMTFPPAGEETPKPKPKLKSDKPIMIMDIECYVNYFLVEFKRISDGAIFGFEQYAGNPLDVSSIQAILKKHEIITFNGNNFDIPILELALRGTTNRELKEACDYLIKTEVPSWRFEKIYELRTLKIDHIDIVELLKGILSLKLYGGRLHCRKLQDLPISESAKLSKEEMDLIFEYCGNDLDVTELVATELCQQIELRRIMSKRYKIDLRSKSDAQIAEAVIKAEVSKLKGEEVKGAAIQKQPFYYKVPDFISFESEKLENILDIVTDNPFTMSAAGRPEMPKELSKLKVKLGYSTYKLGMGGLHSTEKTAFHIADDKYSIWDWDVTSYYPYIILRCGLYPKHMGKYLLDVYKDLVAERLVAKRAGDKIKADLLKIVINGSFGKLGSPWSILYSPDLMVQVTLTGQLSLLMLIEMMEKKGISVISGNTDGIVLKCPRDKEDMMRIIIRRWEKITGFEMESAQYAGLFSRDVNNYIAIKADGKVKTKGCFASASLDKNPENEICNIAMIKYLKYGTPFEDTIRACKDITKFVMLRSVNGGAQKDGLYLGRAVRFYHAQGAKGAIHYCTDNKSVPLTEGAKPIMNLDVPFPDDIDYDWYIDKCYGLFKTKGD